MNFFSDDDSALNLKFPFTVGGAERISKIQIKTERSMAVVSFSLPFNIQMNIQNAQQVSLEKRGDKFIYVFEFESVDDAVEWVGSKNATVQQKSRSDDVKALQREMNEFMIAYESKEKKKRKKLVDEDGFEYYE
ncbi:uncharacterized protein VICG_01872 [Vittaforma corneae ATCC 50505]|uniref:Uncharacterized protein n=1 Tax=Vittaforma corneae (strain ATCC 50505) TaxID=993615 RepID=L2GKE0_VITCO|nr:uncharacterized protein VICG_01872 [Vittaforma corneae ATCC 50505]ELA41079.1 hypothetical protein VICG_01872 [Vittaforma corneae ATCC 50505]